MNISQTKDVLRKQLQSTTRPQGVIFSLVGHTGVGKTSLVKQLAKELKYNYIGLYLATNDSTGDLIGVLRGDEKTKKSIWYKPDWFPETEEPTILFLDEWNRAPQDIRQAIFPLLTERRLHTHKLPDNTIIITAENPCMDNDDMYQVEALDPAMIDRVVRIIVKPDPEEFSIYSIEKDMPIIGEFMKDQSSYFLRDIPSESVYPKNPTPRGLEMANEIVKILTINHPNILEVVAGKLGLEVGNLFIRHLKNNKATYIKMEDMLNDKKKVLEVKNQQADRISKTMSSIFEYIKINPNKFDSPAVSSIIHTLFNEISHDYIAALFSRIGKDPVLSSTFKKSKSYEDIISQIIDKL